MKRYQKGLLIAVFAGLISIPAQAVTLEELAAKVERLSQENGELRQQLELLKQQHQSQTVIVEDLSQAAPIVRAEAVDDGWIKLDHRYSYEMLDPTTNINRKQLYLLQKRAKGEIEQGVYLGGALTPIVDYQKSNTDSKFGYLMRHPTSANQQARTVSEAVIHSAQLQITANLSDWVSGYLELLYDPEQSFGSGTITDINRNQVQVRRGYLLFGDLNRSHFYASLGKMAIPFGLTDTVNPFTASTVWHAFGGLAYGLNGGYKGDSLSLNVMAVQGGAQFRAANVPVDGTNVPSKLNNVAIDINYSVDLGSDSNSDILLGASYIKGSAYCQGYPVTHFSSCEEENGAYDIYSRLRWGDITLQAEFAETEEVWPGTFNPAMPKFDASKVNSWGVGGKYRLNSLNVPVELSFDFSRFEAGPDGAPWEFQDQWVAGVAGFVSPTVKLFGEIIRTEGYAPLNFISGGNLSPGQTHSDRNANSSVVMFGGNLAF